MAIRVPLRLVKPTMRLARPIWDTDGRLIAGSGTLLEERVVRLFRKMAFQTVLVEQSDDITNWVAIKPLEHELRDVEERFRVEVASKPHDAIRQAILRHLTKRAVQLEEDPAHVAQQDPGTAAPVPTPDTGEQEGHPR